MYVGVYIVISRLSLREMREDGVEGFYYVPCGAETVAKSVVVQRLHMVGVYVFYPVWLLDRLMGGPSFASLPLDSLDAPAQGNQED